MYIGGASGKEPTCQHSVQFSCSVVSDSLWPHGLQLTRSHYPSPAPRVYSNSCPLSQWCHPTISSSVFPFSSHLQWRRKWQPTPGFLPGKSHGRRSLVGYSPRVAKSRTWLSNFTFTKNKVSCHFRCFPICLPWSDGTRYHDLHFLNVEF